MNESHRRAPALHRLRVEGVRLYNDGNVLDIALTKPISAFVGANGIGKSTLLALINFGLTGLVPNASSAFPSVDEFAERTSSFAASYFAGRVDESERDSAVVTVEFQLGSDLFEVTRGLFDGRLVRSFRVVNSESGSIVIEDDNRQSPSDLASSYQNAVVAASGLANFDQFSFWQLFMMTFDERRHLLFWDEKTLQSALMISLGRSPQDAIRAEGLSRNIERQDSLARNARWRATQATNKRSKLAHSSGSGSTLTDEEFFAMQQQHTSLLDTESHARKVTEAKELELRDTSRSVAELAIRESELEQTYLSSFAKPDNPRHPRSHPVITAITAGGTCDFCGTQTTALGKHTTAALAANECPICDNELPSVKSSERDSSSLLSLDKDLATARKLLAEARAKYHRIREESVENFKVWQASRQALEDFLSINSRQLAPKENTSYSEEILQYDREISAAINEADEHRRTRDEYRKQLEPIIEGLVEGYEQIETVFVPNFRRLAEKFIGRSVDVEFERRGVSIGLRFALDGQSRRNSTELSESQQYFLDIALRMSIIQTFISGTSTLLVDTPEGSLDIAYETRAGLLFDQFATHGNALVLMSNLNASNLLLELTSLSSPVSLEIFQMLEWAKLSDIQLESSALFERVYDQLEASLKGSEPVE